MVQRNEWAALLLGLTSTFIGIGVSRFAYTPFIPELIHNHWFTPVETAYLGAANLVGYVFGALISHWISEKIGVFKTVMIAFMAVSLSLAFSAVPHSFSLFAILRFIAGAAGAVLMVVSPSFALTSTLPHRRPVVGSFVFTGIGLGILLSALLSPLLVALGLTPVWLILSATAVLFMYPSYWGMSHLHRVPREDSHSNLASPPTRQINIAIILLFIAYGLEAAGFVPHTVFWVDFLSREQHLGSNAASLQWGIVGIGAIIGALVAGQSAHRIRWSQSLIWAFIIFTIAIIIPFFSTQFIAKTTSSFTVGALIPAVVTLVSGRLSELLNPALFKKYWGVATVSFALMQALSGLAMSAFFKATGKYHWLFLYGSLLLLFGTLCIIASHYKIKNKQISGEVERTNNVL